MPDEKGSRASASEVAGRVQDGMTFLAPIPVSLRSAEEEASTLLEEFWADPFGQVMAPVDPVRLARSLGLGVFVSELESGVSVVLVKKEGAPAVHLSASRPPLWQRFGCAHAVGHFLQRLEGEEREYGHIDQDEALASGGEDEEYANAFARALLMPEHLVRRHAELQDRELAKRFQVPLEAMTRRREVLGL